MEYTFFNVTNPRDVLSGMKPVVREIGPFVYVERQERYDLTWDAVKDTMSYREHKYYVYDKARTVRAQYEKSSLAKVEIFSDPKGIRITSINAISLGALAKLGPNYWKMTERIVWKNDFQRLFSQQTPDEYVNGYDVPGLGALGLSFPGINPNISIREDDPDYVHPTTVRVGKKDTSKILEIVSFRGSDKLTTTCPWGTNPLVFGRYCPNHYPCCASRFEPNERVPIWDEKSDFTQGRVDWQPAPNAVRGTNGEQFRMNLKKNDFVVVFFDLVMRALKMENVDGEESSHHGIDLLTFRPARSFWANAQHNEFNNRFYQWGPNGLVNLTTVQQGAPLFTSLPHFLNCDPMLREKVLGLSPNSTKHASWIGVEPTTGITMIERNRAMVSTRLPTSNGGLWPKLKDKNVFVPFVWFEASSEITENGVENFRQISNARVLRTRVYAVSGAACCAALLTLLFVESKRRRSTESVPYDPLSEENGDQ